MEIEGTITFDNNQKFKFTSNCCTMTRDYYDKYSKLELDCVKISEITQEKQDELYKEKSNKCVLQENLNNEISW